MVPADSQPVRLGFCRRLSFAIVERPRLVITIGIILWLALCAAVWREGLDAGLSGEDLARDREWLGPIRDWAVWALLPFAVIWQRLWRKYCDGDEASPATGTPLPPTLSGLKRGRIFNREPVRHELLPRFGALGCAGIIIGVALSLWIALAVGAGGTSGTRQGFLVFLACLALVNVHCGAQVLRDVVLLSNEDHFIAHREEELAARIADSERRQAESEREYERKSVSGWQQLLLFGGFLGGIFLFSKILGERDGVVAFQASVSALIGSAVWLYTARLRPQRWQAWRAFAVVGALAFLAMTFYHWGAPWVAIVSGLAWGGAIGVFATSRYLRKLRS